MDVSCLPTAQVAFTIHLDVLPQPWQVSQGLAGVGDSKITGLIGLNRDFLGLVID